MSKDIATQLRQIADLLDPLPEASDDPFIVEITLRRDGEIIQQIRQPMPCVGDGMFGGMNHPGPRIFENGVPIYDQHYNLSVQRVGARGIYSMTKDDQLHEEFYEKCREWLVDHGWEGEGSGEVLYFPVADGKAAYMVAHITQGHASASGMPNWWLMFLPIHGDAYQLPEAHERGLTVSDVRGMIQSQRKLDELFGRKKK